ncbi:WD40-repeat-containing domain protein [Kockovaella imperatae]|uniref:WD40-repeat-containing domain protein n=1 Tax=Kockovaella imperatae TaxID=4999 RepID=A0A1Y1UPC1_9TREE|nr:WD40-repeat-containing domain protein [Kockovaella imperatae]ORX39407.1 WD40-repeat-containing domain protein [Kockovaella imperatae]
METLRRRGGGGHCRRVQLSPRVHRDPSASKMASSDYVQRLIAQYLAHSYPSALPSFLEATHLEHLELNGQDAPDTDLRTIVEDYYLSTKLPKQLDSVEISTHERDSLGQGWKGWTAKDIAGIKLDPDVKLGGVIRSIDGISAANLLTVMLARIPYREFDTASAEYRARFQLDIVTTSVDKTIKFINHVSGEVSRILQPHQAAILAFDVHPLNPRYLVTGSMDGTTILTDLITLQPLQTFRSNKFVVRVAFSPCGRFLATASYDRDIVIYQASSSHSAPPQMQDEDDDDHMLLLDELDHPDLACDPALRYEPVKRITCDSNPESILFHPASTWLMYTLRNAYQMFYVRLPDPSEDISVVTSSSWETRTKSFNPSQYDTHVSFSVLNMILHPSGKLVACQTGDHRGTSGERVLLYGVEPEETERLGCLWTGSESDDFVLPRMAWIPDGSGIITTSPNGYLNLLSLDGTTRSSVKVHGGTTQLGQASSQVVRDIAMLQQADGTWSAVSVGYDRQIRFTR